MKTEVKKMFTVLVAHSLNTLEQPMVAHSLNTMVAHSLNTLEDREL